MAVLLAYTTITVTDGVNYVIDQHSNIPLYEIVGTEILTSNWSITVTPGSSAGAFIRFIYNANVSLGGNHIFICGAQLPDNLSTKNTTIEALYDGSAWVVTFLADFEAASIVATDDIMDDAVTNDKLSNMVRGTIKVGGVANAPTDLNAKTSGQILVGDGTDIVSVPVSGDATLSAAGALTIAADAVTNTKLANITRGYIKVGGVGDAPTDLNAKTNGYILIGDGTDIKSVAVTGDVNISSSGITTIVNNKIMADATDPSPDFLDAKVHFSIVEDNIVHKIGLDGDDLAPGPYMLYGTNAVGSKCWTNRPLTYIGYITQTGTAIPSLLEVSNQLGPISLSRIGVGVYTLNYTGIPITSKVFVMCPSVLHDGSGLVSYITAENTSYDTIQIKTFDASAPATPIDGGLSRTPIYIAVETS